MATGGDIQFPPGQRRDKPSFEPPPWEQDQFDELERRKQQEQAIHPTQGAPAAAEEVPDSEEPSDDASVAAIAEVTADKPESGSTEVRATRPELDPKQVEILMMGLRSEEPRAEQAYWKITILAGLVCMLVGLAVATWGFLALASPEKAGVAGGFIVAVLLVFGIGFMAAGAWVVFSSLRQRGVL